jgi:hypothetical protein
MLRESGVNCCPIRKIAFHKNGLGMHGCTMALAEIVKHHHRLTSGDQLLDNHAANVAGSACDQDCHAFLSLK